MPGDENKDQGKKKYSPAFVVLVIFLLIIAIVAAYAVVQGTLSGISF